MKMADDDSSTTSDESLDAKSEKFDPMKVLYATKSRLSTLPSPIYDNVCKFESVMTKRAAGSSKKVNKQPEVETRMAKRFSSHQEPVASTARSLEGKNVLSKMEKILGPLGMLHGCMESRTRVKVYTRNAIGIRGHVEAYVAAFDKHWNLALEDCFEIWTRRIKRKSPALGAPSKVSMRQEAVPKIVVRKIEGKTETLERHVPQMLLRGEQVAMIVKIIN
ncbi:hypothetical protein KM043_004696 [Ampulex compressa]|nr:hypothetical protein KM043_004696 [Ampulex compressa]